MKTKNNKMNNPPVTFLNLNNGEKSKGTQEV